MIIMVNRFRYVDACRLCASTNLESVLTLKPSPLGDQYLPKGGSAKSANLIPFGISRAIARIQSNGLDMYYTTESTRKLTVGDNNKINIVSNQSRIVKIKKGQDFLYAGDFVRLG